LAGTEPELAAPESLPPAAPAPVIGFCSAGGDEPHASRHDAATNWPRTSVLRIGSVIQKLVTVPLVSRQTEGWRSRALEHGVRASGFRRSHRERFHERRSFYSSSLRSTTLLSETARTENYDVLMSAIEGGCFCGAVRYKIDGALGRASACHCSRCRKAFSGASSAYAEIPDGSKFSWVIGEDKLNQHIFANAWGLAFCRICGSTLCGILAGKVHGVTLGTVDGDPGVQLEMHIFVGSKAAWDQIGGSAPQFNEECPHSDASEAVARFDS